ncbi:hypothetical protein BDN70DRAFT_884283 [Pholiota conissans]|uniref:Peptidase C14 caspase domain-containing protein n=1 Tax=Pholiota conissans TaxID=109636 RepID=A0A9P5YUQ1_9AGAR|nr:hypothetical protein BDN70DRAFT_884283 [Pholiota conissans]
MGEKIRLFALLIGINDYKVPFENTLPISGAVPDAFAFKGYLEKYLNVPSSQINMLINEQATRNNIINALKAIWEDKEQRIEKDDAIFLYYAGHGTQIDPPKERRVEPPQQIQAIVPHDCDSLDSKGSRVPPIPDYMLEILLSKIAEKKGDNITAVFDCCHSASATRSIVPSHDEGITRSVKLKATAAYADQLSQEITTIQPAVRSVATSSKYSHRGLGSHILLSACETSEEAKEDNRHGRFSTALLGLLKEVPADTLRYSEIFHHPKFAKITGQNPQCEGTHVERILFNAKVLPSQRKSFDISFDAKEHHYIVHGGSIHNISLDSEFGLFLKTDFNFATQLGTLCVGKLLPFTFEATLPKHTSTLDLSKPMIATQTKFGTQGCLHFYTPPKDGFRKFYAKMAQTPELASYFYQQVDRVEESKDAQVEIQTVVKNKFKFTMTTPTMVPNQVAITQTQVVDADKMGRKCFAGMFPKIAHFYRELRYVNIEPKIARFIGVELYRLRDKQVFNKDVGYAEDILVPDGPNLCVRGIIDLHIPNEEAEGKPYGIRLVNKSAFDLYANVYHFDTHDLSISCLAAANVTYNDHVSDIPLKKGGRLCIGFGPAGYEPKTFQIKDKLDLDIGFLKIYLSTKFVDLSYLQQPTPFVVTRAISSFVRPTQLIWTNIVVPVILRRKSIRPVERN